MTEPEDDGQDAVPVERVPVPGQGIDIPYEMSRALPGQRSWSALVERRVDGQLRPVPVWVDPATWEVTLPDGWRPVYRDGGRTVIVALERDLPGDH